MDETQAIVIIDNDTGQVSAGLRPPLKNATPNCYRPPMHEAIEEWLQNVARRSGRTRHAYQTTLQQYRTACQHEGLDLDSIETPEERAELKRIALAFMSYSARGKQVSAATVNNRLAILSSFYGYGMLEEWFDYNPIAHIRREKVSENKSVQVLSTERIARVFAHMDYRRPEDCRDSALLQVLLDTCRRVSEVASLQWQHVRMEGDQLLLFFAHCKGEKQTTDKVSQKAAYALLRWLHAFYGPDLSKLPPETPLFVSLAPAGYNRVTKQYEPSYGKKLSIQAIGKICERRLGTSKVHTTRHTGSRRRIEQGATPIEMQKKLLHSSMHTTTRYIEAVQEIEDVYADRVADAFGFN